MAKSLQDKLISNTEEMKKPKENVQLIHPRSKMNNTLKKMEGRISKALGKVMESDRFLAQALTTYSNNPAFWECSDISFLSALMMSAQCGLEPNTPLGESYLIPYGNKVQFQLGYKGLITLAYRTGSYKSIYAHDVYKNDNFEFYYGLNKNVIHKPSLDPEGEAYAYYAVYKLQNGGEDFTVWGKQRVINHAKQYSKTFNKASSSWQQSFDSMARKTCLIDVLKYAPKSVELAKAISMDNSVKEDIDERMEEVPEVEVDASIVNVEFKEAEQVSM